MRTVEVRIAGNRASLLAAAERIGLAGAARLAFAQALVSVEVTVAVDEATGASRIVAVEGRRVVE